MPITFLMKTMTGDNPMTFGRFMKVWMIVSFSRMMWTSWYFIFVYFLCLVSHLQNGFSLSSLGIQLFTLVVLALLFGLMGCVGGYLQQKAMMKNDLPNEQIGQTGRLES
jgi:hypothetical protein